MRSFFENKRLVLSLAVLALGALTVLAISLNQVPFREGQHFGQKEVTQFQTSAEEISQIWVNVPIWKQVVLWTLGGLLVVLIGLLLSPEMRKRMLILLIRMVVTVWAVYFLLRNYADRLFGLNLGGAATEQPGPNEIMPIPVFEPPQVSPAFSYLISFLFALVWLAVLWGLYRGWKKFQLLNTRKPLDEIAKIARSSLEDL